MSIAAEPQTSDEPQTDAEEAELRRQSQRQSLKEQIAKLKIREAKTRLLRDQIAAVEAETDAAADEHRSRCEPLQLEMTEIEARHITELTAKRKQDPADAKRQRELLGLINAANAELELTAEANKRTIAGINKQIRELQPPPGSENFTPSTLQDQLVRLSSDSDLIQLEAMREWATISGRVAKGVSADLRKWQAAAESELSSGHGEEVLTTGGSFRRGGTNHRAVETYLKRAKRLEITLSLAGSVHAEANRALSEFRAQLIDA